MTNPDPMVEDELDGEALIDRVVEFLLPLKTSDDRVGKFAKKRTVKLKKHNYARKLLRKAIAIEAKAAINAYTTNKIIEARIDWDKDTSLWSSGGSLRSKLQEYAHRYMDAETRKDQEAFTDDFIKALNHRKTL